MTALQRSCQRRGSCGLSSGLDVKDSAIGADSPSRSRMCIWIFLETVDESRLPRAAAFHVVCIFRELAGATRRVDRSYELLWFVHVGASVLQAHVETTGADTRPCLEYQESESQGNRQDRAAAYYMLIPGSTAAAQIN